MLKLLINISLTTVGTLFAAVAIVSSTQPKQLDLIVKNCGRYSVVLSADEIQSEEDCDRQNPIVRKATIQQSVEAIAYPSGKILLQPLTSIKKAILYPSLESSDAGPVESRLGGYDFYVYTEPALQNKQVTLVSHFHFTTASATEVIEQHLAVLKKAGLKPDELTLSKAYHLIHYGFPSDAIAELSKSNVWKNSLEGRLAYAIAIQGVAAHHKNASAAEAMAADSERIFFEILQSEESSERQKRMALNALTSLDNIDGF